MDPSKRYKIIKLEDSPKSIHLTIWDSQDKQFIAGQMKSPEIIGLPKRQKREKKEKPVQSAPPAHSAPQGYEQAVVPNPQHFMPQQPERFRR